MYLKQNQFCDKNWYLSPGPHKKRTMETVFSLGMSFLAICWLIVDVSNVDVSNALHVAQMIHVEDRGWRGLLVHNLSTHILYILQTWPPLLLPTQALCMPSTGRLPDSSNILCYWDIHLSIAAYGYMEW